MPIITNTVTSNNARGNRESLDDVVSRITPEDTPVYSMLGSEKANAVFEEWAIDTLRTPAENVQAEGDEYAFNAIAPVTRVGNYTQILRDSFIISETQEAVKNAGNIGHYKEQKLKIGINLKKDFELSLVSNTASVATNTGRKSGGLPTWITTNVSRGASGANGGYNQGTKLTVAATNGTQRAFTKGLLDNVMQQVFNSGGNAKKLVTSPYVKVVFSSFMNDSSVIPLRIEGKSGGKNTVTSSIDMYKGDFDMITIVPNRVMATNATTARNAFILDPELISCLKLRPFAEDKKASENKTGDAKKCVIIGEMTLKVKNEAGLGIVADLFGINQTT
jgi:hypothetical protein